MGWSFVLGIHFYTSEW